MLTVETRHAIDPNSAKALDTDGLRSHFLVDGLFKSGEIRLAYTHYDRMIVGAAVPDGSRARSADGPPSGGGGRKR